MLQLPGAVSKNNVFKAAFVLLVFGPLLQNCSGNESDCDGACGGIAGSGSGTTGGKAAITFGGQGNGGVGPVGVGGANPPGSCDMDCAGTNNGAAGSHQGGAFPCGGTSAGGASNGRMPSGVGGGSDNVASGASGDTSLGGAGAGGTIRSDGGASGASGDASPAGAGGVGGDHTCEGKDGSANSSQDCWKATVVEGVVERCLEPGMPISKPMTLSQFEALITRVWLYCEGTIEFGRNDAAGLEIDGDNAWYFLLKQPDGSVVRGQGFNSVGTWSVIDLTSVNGAGSFQLNLDLPSGGNAVFATFAFAPEKVFLASMGGSAEFIAVPQSAE